MRVAFLDPANWDYDSATPLRRPLAGSQSALCYLAVELARAGHEVAVLNGIAVAGEYDGVRFLNMRDGATGVFLNRFDALVVLNLADALFLQQDLDIRIPKVLWLSHAHDQPAVAPLADERQRSAWAGYAFVSEWQQRECARRFGIAGERSRVMRNAMAPVFAEMNPDPPWFARAVPPVLAYTSTPFRGLSVLLMAFPAIRSAIPGTSLRVFSSMSVYQVAAAEDQFAGLYAQCAAIEGIEYVGALPQRQLAGELRGVAGLAYPSIFAETSCIAVIEAMAAGAFIFTTRLGALPETTNGFAFMAEPRGDPGALAESFAAMTVAAVRALTGNPAAASARRDAQIAFVRDNFSWSLRAREWSSWLAALIGG
jgi:glycosyltransferase involved in cell wall biosynthesis